MKITKPILLSALFLAFAALSASAAPVPEVVPADAQAQAEVQPSDVFGSSVLSQSADCAGANAQAVSLDPNQCGSCSVAACRGKLVNGFCGSGIGGAKYCRDWAGFLCTDGGSHCQCTNTIIP